MKVCALHMNMPKCLEFLIFSDPAYNVKCIRFNDTSIPFLSAEPSLGSVC